MKPSKWRALPISTLGGDCSSPSPPPPRPVTSTTFSSSSTSSTTHHGHHVGNGPRYVGQGSRAAPEQIRRKASEEHQAGLPLPEEATWIWSESLVDGEVSCARGGTIVFLPNGYSPEVQFPTAPLCSSTRAELHTLRAQMGKEES